MSITASRLGNTSITLDWGVLAGVLPRRDPTARLHTPDQMALQDSWKRLQARFNSGEVGFFDAPENPLISQVQETKALAAKILATRKFQTCLFLGIGGSSLGPKSLLFATEHLIHPQAMKFRFIENPDALDWSVKTRDLNPDTTLVIAVTKSGNTFETVALLMLAFEWLGQSRWKTHTVAVTDPEQGELRKLVREQGLESLSIHPSLGGRFSVFSPVALLALALSGLSCDEFLEGANQIRHHALKTAPEKNPLFIICSHLIQHAKDRPIHVFMPYSTRLHLITDWWAQAWAESLGKDGKGFTPMRACGAIDQHSILQLLRDGPDDKVIFFLETENLGIKTTIPRLDLPIPQVPPTFKSLQGKSLEWLLREEYRATAKVLAGRGRPTYTLRMESISLQALGSLYFSLALKTAFCGTLWGVNPFDQPGVEEGKVYLRESLGSGSVSGASGQRREFGSDLHQRKDHLDSESESVLDQERRERILSRLRPEKRLDSQED